MKIEMHWLPLKTLQRILLVALAIVFFLSGAIALIDSNSYASQVRVSLGVTPCSRLDLAYQIDCRNVLAPWFVNILATWLGDQPLATKAAARLPGSINPAILLAQTNITCQQRGNLMERYWDSDLSWYFRWGQFIDFSLIDFSSWANLLSGRCSHLFNKHAQIVINLKGKNREQVDRFRAAWLTTLATDILARYKEQPIYIESITVSYQDLKMERVTRSGGLLVVVCLIFGALEFSPLMRHRNSS